jgi:hypothetical protein
VTTIDVDPGAMPSGALELELERLHDEERRLSRRRDRLHRRIEFLKAGGATDDPSRELLASVEGEERYVSKTRRAVHRRIDELREEQLRRGGLR